MKDFKVKVYRYHPDGFWDAWFVSKVYAIDGNKLLVYDNGDNTAFDWNLGGFRWVNITDPYRTPEDDSETVRPIVEPWENENE